jgi:hypothetical protein
VDVSLEGVAAGKKEFEGFDCVAGVVDAPNKPFPCCGLLGVAGGNVEAKALPKSEPADEGAGFPGLSFEEPSLLKVVPSLKPLLPRPVVPFVWAGGNWGVGVASSRSLFCASLASLFSDSLLDPKEDVPCPNLDPWEAGVTAHEESEDPVPDGMVTVEPPKLDSVLRPLNPPGPPENDVVCCPRPVNGDFCCPAPENKELC